MIASLKPYPSYKDSGVEWIGHVPESWELWRGKRAFKKVERPVRSEDDVVTCFRDGQVTLRRLRRAEGFTEAIEESGYQGIRAGDLVIHQMDAFAGAVGVAEADGKGTPVYAVCVPRAPAIDASYFKRVVREMALRGWIAALAKGIRERSTDFRFDTFGRQVLPVPPAEDQAAIVRYLDHIDSRIQRFIAAKERLIELLEEEKQAVIHRAATRGLDPDVPLKPSGVDWLGDMPKHWDLVPNRALLSTKKQVVGQRFGDYPLLSLTKQGVILRDLEKLEGKIPESFDTYQVIKPGDFVFCLFDIDETPRAVGRSDLAGMITGAYTRFVCRYPDAAEFVYLFYLAMDDQKRLKPLYTGLRKVIKKETFLSAKMPLPPVEERTEILAHIANFSRTIDSASVKAKREIGLLREYRARLISDVVTGALDVREAARHVPERDRTVGRDNALESTAS